MRRLLLGAVTAAAAGCGASAGGWTLPDGQQCAPTTPTERRIALADVLHVDSLGRALAELPLGLRAAAVDTAVFSIGYDQRGALTPVRWASPGAAADDDARVSAIFAQHARAQGPPRGFSTGIVVRDQELRVLPWVPAWTCAPLLTDRTRLTDEIQRLARSYGLQGRSAVAHLLVGRDGRVHSVTMVRSTGSIEADQEVSRIFSSARFVPARFENHALPATVELPLAVSGSRR